MEPFQDRTSNRERSIRKNLFYHYGLLGAALSGIAILAVQESPARTSDLLLAILVTILIAVGRSVTFKVSTAGASHMGTPALIAGVLILDPVLAVAAAAIGAALSDIVTHRLTENSPLNIGISSVQAFVALAVIHAAGWNPEAPDFRNVVLICAIFLAGGLAIVAAGLMVSISAWLQNEGPLLALFREIMNSGAPTIYMIDISKICFGIVAAMLVTWTPFHVLIIVVPVAAMSQVLARAIALRRQLEQALRETEHSLSEAQRLAQLGSWEWEISSRYMQWSDQLFTITGLNPGEPTVSLSDLRNLLPLSERSRLERIVGEIFETHSSAEFDHEIVRPDGSIRFVHHSLTWVSKDERAEDRLVGTVLDITERKRLEIELRHQAYHDGLTGLPNRELFLERLEETLALDRSTSRTMAVIFLDLDNFKEINDRYGHETGDQVLVELARRLQSRIGIEDTAARLSGDEFTVLVAGEAGGNQIEVLATRLLGAIQYPVQACGNVVSISASAGLVYIGRHHESPSDVLREADKALYRAKAAGRNRLCIEPEPFATEQIAALREPA